MSTPRPLWRASLASLVAQATAALVPAMVVREADGHDEAGTSLERAAAGAGAAIPLAIGLCILGGRTVHAPAEPIVYLIAAAVPCAVGLFGGIVARRFRHRPDWSDPL